MIDEKVLIKRVKEYQGKIKLNFGNRGNFDFMEVEAVKDIANKLAEEINNWWIPYSERLPENRQIVLVTFVEHNELVVETVKYLNGEWEDPKYSEWTLDEKDVLAWMPLPAPYKEV